MNKKMKQHLEAVVEAVIFSNTEAATAAFHDYISLKTQSILLGEAEECEDEECDDKDDKKEDKKDSKKEDDKEEDDEE